MLLDGFSTIKIQGIKAKSYKSKSNISIKEENKFSDNFEKDNTNKTT
jgi:hypothetical protein